MAMWSFAVFGPRVTCSCSRLLVWVMIFIWEKYSFRMLCMFWFLRCSRSIIMMVSLANLFISSAAVSIDFLSPRAGVFWGARIVLWWFSFSAIGAVMRSLSCLPFPNTMKPAMFWAVWAVVSFIRVGRLLFGCRCFC